MASIGFLTPYKHLPDFKDYVESNFKCLNLSRIKKEEIKMFKGIDYLFGAPNYLRYVIEDSDIEGTNIKGIISPSTGLNHIKAKSVPTFSIKNDKILDTITSTAEHNLFLILAITRQVGKIQELSKMTLGILGYGRLGKLIYNICKNIFKDVLISDLDHTDEDFFKDTDFLSINIDLRDKNINFINENYLSKFDKNLFIINTARGEVINEDDILNSITSGKVLGYATDVLKEEHSDKATNLKICNDPRIIKTSHIGGTAIQAQEVAYKHVIGKLDEKIR